MVKTTTPVSKSITRASAPYPGTYGHALPSHRRHQEHVLPRATLHHPAAAPAHSQPTADGNPSFQMASLEQGGWGAGCASRLPPAAFHPQGLTVKAEGFARRLAGAAQPSPPPPEQSGAGGRGQERSPPCPAAAWRQARERGTRHAGSCCPGTMGTAATARLAPHPCSRRSAGRGVRRRPSFKTRYT